MNIRKLWRWAQDKTGKSSGPIRLPKRSGSPPQTTSVSPHQQLDQGSSAFLIDELCRRCRTLPGVREQPSAKAVAGTRALWLVPHLGQGPAEAFLVDGEFIHIHLVGSLHMALPPRWLREATRKGWAETHPMVRARLITSGIVLVYAARDERELTIVFRLVTQAYRHACGEQDGDDGSR